MAGNLTTEDTDLSTVPSGTVIATDLIAGVNYQRVKPSWGAAGTANDVSAASPLPVDLTNTGANATALKVDGSAVTQPMSAAALPLPTGAATAAKQPELGTAGTPSADVISVQGVTSMTALKVDGSGVTQPVSATSLPLPTGAATVAKQPALGTAGTPSADVISVQGVTSMTALKVDGSGVTQPVSYATTGAGSATGALRVEIANNGAGQIATVSAVTAITNALPAGTNTLGKTYIAPQTTKALTNASVSISSSGDNTVVAGTASQTVRVFKLVLVAASAVNVTIKDGTGGTALTGAIPLVANGAITIDDSSGEPEFITSSSNAFVVNLSSGVTVTGWVQYTKS